jgi:hypothetical protein
MDEIAIPRERKLTPASSTRSPDGGEGGTKRTGKPIIVQYRATPEKALKVLPVVISRLSASKGGQN